MFSIICSWLLFHRVNLLPAISCIHVSVICSSLLFCRVNLLPAMLNQGWCNLIPTLLEAPDHDAREKVLLMMQLVLQPCEQHYQSIHVIERWVITRFSALLTRVCAFITRISVMLQIMILERKYCQRYNLPYSFVKKITTVFRLYRLWRSTFTAAIQVCKWVISGFIKWTTLWISVSSCGQ